MGYRQRVGLQVEVQLLYPFQRLQRCAQLAFFAGAIHLLDEIDKLRRPGLHDRLHANVVKCTQDCILAGRLMHYFHVMSGQVKNYILDAINLR